MGEAEDRERGGQSLVPLREIRGARERLTEAQARVLLALATGYSVCMSMSSSVASHERVLVGNGSRLAAVTVESLLLQLL